MVRVALVVLVAAAACGKSGGPKQGSGGPVARPDAVIVRIAYSSEKKAWFDEAVPAFQATHPTTPAGRPIQIDARSYGSGEAASAILDGSFRAHVFAPASGAYVNLLNQTWQTGATPHAKPLSPAGEPLVLSPIVIAMWKPMAEALGWPGKDIGWKQLIAVSKDPRGWGAYGHPEWGSFKLGHTHPEYSNSGLLAVLAEAFAGAGKTRGLARDDLAAKSTRDYLGAIESAIVHYGKSTGLFTDAMLARGPGYMSACVTYENLVIESYGKPGAAFPLVAVYPVEGTFWADHPYAILDAEWVGADERAGAQAFLAFLKARPMQQRALALGFRPADSSIAMAAPIDAAHGVDPKQPQTLLEMPGADVLGALLDAWRHEKKAADVMIVFDHSGSMEGEPLTEAKAGAKAFLESLGDRDSVAIEVFDDHVPPPPEPVELARARPALEKLVDDMFASGGTALYDAIGASYKVMAARARRDPGRIHALVVMTDGKDESSRELSLDQLLAQLAPEDAQVKVFTIAYGDDADPRVLEQIASAGQGTSVKGAPDTIVQVYRDLSAFF
ncbi:MAG TPA: VWA domain-containing protein [Kofleriaceae bacterium]|nr:VWA domain-containing protein [Kofleriaceae bacterium]